jgi:LysR family cys regulon transcriptional activator
MNLSQLRYLREIVRCRLNISRAATALRTSQPAMSQQIRALEEELGVPLFVRTRNRLMRLTEAGESVVEAAHSALNEIAKVHAVGRSRTAAQFSSLRIGCTHAQARYALPHAARLFRRRYPGIQLQVMHKHDEELWQLVQNGQAELAITTDAQNLPKGLVYLPCTAMKRALIAPRNHPVLRLTPITLETIAEFPLVTFNESSSGRRRLMKAFGAHGYTPRISACAEDEDVIKEFVREGLGITILASIVYDSKRDSGLGAIDVTRLLEPSTTGIIVRWNMLRHEPIRALIEAYAPIWSGKRLDLELTRYEK